MASVAASRYGVRLPLLSQFVTQLRTYTTAAAIVGFILVSQGTEIYRHWLAKLTHPVAHAADVEVAVRTYFDPYAITVPALALDSVAFSGQNEGGSDAFTGKRRLASRNADGSPVQYIVQGGDTLSGIAAKYDLHSGSIHLANPDMPSTETLQVGQVLTIPAEDASEEALEKEFEERQAKIAATAPKKITSLKGAKSLSLSTAPSLSIRKPVREKYVSQGYSRIHPGIDFAASIGSPIHAAKAGCVISISRGWNGGYGTMIHLNHGGGISTLYAHLTNFVNGMGMGSCVDAGEVIGYVGSTGRSTGPHLHFELRVGGVPRQPAL